MTVVARVPAGFRHRYAAWSLDFAILAAAAVVLAWPKLPSAWRAVTSAFLALWTSVGNALAEALMAGAPVPALARDLLHDPHLLDASAELQAAIWRVLWPVLAGYVLLAAAWHVLGSASSLQGSPGKYGFGLRVGDRDGARLSLAAAAGRHLAAGLSWLSLNLGHLMALPAPHRALHDRIAGTVVSRRAGMRRLPPMAAIWIALQLVALALLLAWLLRRYVAAIDAALGG